MIAKPRLICRSCRLIADEILKCEAYRVLHAATLSAADEGEASTLRQMPILLKLAVLRMKYHGLINDARPREMRRRAKSPFHYSVYVD